METAELSRISDAIRESMGDAYGQFKQAADQNNSNVIKVVRDIARVFTEQRADLSHLSNASEQNITETQKLNSEIQSLNASVQESISIQTSMFGAMKSMVEGITGLSNATEALNESIAGGGNSVTGLLGGILRAFDFMPGAFKTAIAGITIGAGGTAAYNLMGGGSGHAQLTGAGGSFNAEKAAQLIRKVGGTEQEAAILGAISQPESAGNPNAHNPNRATGDNSYGLWQINMIENLEQERLKKYKLKNKEELFDPEVNARVALQMLREAHGVPRDWTTWKNNKHLPYMDAARAGATGKMATETSTPKSDATPVTTSETTPNLTPKSTPTETTTGQSGNKDGIISSTANADSSDAKQFLQSRETGRGQNTGVQAEKLDGEFATKLMSAIKAAEQATGTKVGITEGYRDPHVQAQYYSDYIGRPITYDGKTYQPNPAKFGRLAAPPGRSNHQKGMAADLSESPAREWIRVHASEFGLRQLGSKDLPHFELANASSKSGGSTGSADFSVGGNGATPVSGGSPITPGMGGGEETQSISQQAMAAAQPAPISPEVQQLVDSSTKNLIGGGMGMNVGGMMGMLGGAASLMPSMAPSFDPASLQQSTNNTGVLLNNNEQQEITNQLKEAAVSKQAQAEISQETVATAAQPQINIPESRTGAPAMFNGDQGVNYNNDTGVPEWASKFFLGWHETNKFKTWG